MARRLGEHRAAGRGLLLTEDSVRWCTVLALESVGVSPDRLAIEVLTPALAGGKLDLTVDGSDGTVIELKYPRASRTGISPDTMTLGELIRDFLRVAVVDAADRWVVQVLQPELRRYLSRREELSWPTAVGQQLVLTRERLGTLRKTALDAIGVLPWHLPVTATCLVAHPVDVDLSLFAFRVDAPDVGSVPAPLAAAAPVQRRAAAGTGTGAPVRGGARAEVLAAVHDLVARSGRSEVTLAEVVDEMRRRGSAYAESTVRTMMSSHMCAQVHGPNIGSYDDLDRVGHGRYRLRQTS
ncbi:DUF7669 domain-containing protein [Nocardioides koreensis]|uniref:DUF7669 domain-containing protein n=1 Tax=Nocardioides koreensis TaxID=433651 RepID=UPI0031CED89D